jgi:hypothetical protein
MPPEAPLAADPLGRLRVLSEPAGALVAIDDVEHGPAPVTVDDLAPGEHEITVRSGDYSYTRSVLIDADTTTSIVVTGPPAPSTGWIAATAATPLQMFESGHLIGTTGERILLPVGTHDLEFAADALGFRAARRVTIGGGTTTTVSVALPRSTVNVNALPWADVWIDGTPVGQTPIANLPQTIGAHEIEFRHPELGTRTVEVVVSLEEPARITMDMR